VADEASVKSSIPIAAAVLGVFFMAGCYRPPHDAELIQNFEAHRAEFNRLLVMSGDDAAFNRIAKGEIPPRGMDPSRFWEYEEVFRDLDIQNGINRGMPGFPEGFFILSGTDVPIGGKGEAVGYVYSAVAPKPIVSRLPIPAFPLQTHNDHGEEFFFRALEKNWYLFYEVAW
jgi:hypothetical protein